jgi:stearoyl-CoA desaturase (delta-9 desaturase)
MLSRTAEQLARRFNPEHIAQAIKSSVHETELSSVRDALLLLQQRADLRWNLHPPHMPTRDQLLAAAQEMFAKTRFLDDIVERAYGVLIESVGSLLISPPRLAVANPKSRASLDGSSSP